MKRCITPTFSFQANMRHIRGRHRMKWGFQTQVKRNNAVPGGRPAGTYSFDRGFTQGPDPTAKATNVGYGIASYLLGTPASGYVDLNADDAAQSPYYGTYFQDDIHVSQKLFDYTTANPIQAAAQAAYAKSPIPELPVQNFAVPGGLMFADSSHRRSGITDKTNFSPRFGLAYRINDKTVFRGGFGVFYTYWWSPFVRQLGFSSQTPFVASVDGITPANVLSNPFPNGLAKPLGSSQGMATLLGATINFYDQYRMQPYNERWSIGLQRQLSRDFRLEANYVGQTGFRLPVGTGGQEQDRELHYLPAQYLTLGNRLFQTVPNPFYGLIPATSALGAKTISVQNLLSTYPEFTSVDVTRQTQGKSYYHSLQVVATKSMSHGIQILGTYTYSKLLEKVRFSDVSDSGPARQIGEFDRPQRITLGAVMELPFGPGKSIARSGLPGKLAGGWQLNIVQIFQSGDAMAINPAVMSTGIDPRVDPGQRNPNYWFNPAAFVTLPSFTARTLPYRLAQLRSDAIANWDLSLVKDTALTERVKLQLRWEAFNAFNRCQFAAPNLDPRNSNYDRILSQSNSPRDMQLALKLRF